MLGMYSVSVDGIWVFLEWITGQLKINKVKYIY
jgi:hypothetical protein